MARSWSKLAVAVVVPVAMVFGLAGCTASEPDEVPTGPPVTVASFESTESQILAELYAQALEHEGAQVTRTFGLAGRDATMAALGDGSADVVPELNGELLSFFAPDSASKDKITLNKELRKLLPEGLQILDVSPAQSTIAYVVTRETAEASALKSLADVAAMGAVSVAATPAFAELAYGIPGLKGSYGVSATLSAVDDAGGAETVAALLDGSVQLAAIPSTSPAIAENDLVVLSDPKALMRVQNVVPLIRSDIYTIRIANALNEVSNRLRSEDIAALRAQVEGAEKLDIAQVAKVWLRAEGITS